MEKKQNRFMSFLARQKKEIIQEFKSEPPKKLIQNTMYVLLGSLLLAIGTEFFLVPLEIVSGGVTSLAIIFNRIPGWNVISVENFIMIINWIYFFVGLFVLGVKYSMKTLVVTLFYPLFVYFFDFLINTIEVNGVHVLNLSEVAGFTIVGTELSQDSTLAIAYIIGAMMGALISGVGVGFALAGGGSSGGTDVQVLLIHKFTHLSVGISSFLSDSIIIIIGFFATGLNFLSTVVGIMAALILAIALDKIFASKTNYYMAFIVSKKWKEINDYIINEVGRGTTLIEAQGGSSGTDSKLIEVCFDSREYNQIEKIINHIDPNAFVSVMTTTQIFGYGFSRSVPEVDIKDMALSPDETQKILQKAKKMKEKEERKEEEEHESGNH